MGVGACIKQKCWQMVVGALTPVEGYVVQQFEHRRIRLRVTNTGES